MFDEGSVGCRAAPRPWYGSAIAATALLVAACSNNNDTFVPPPVVTNSPGAVIVDWTIRGGKDAADCQASGATTLHVVLAGTGGAQPMEYVQECAAFATTISGLLPDRYTGSVELLDASGAARTTSVNLVPFVVPAGQTVTIGVDFPSNSFF